LTQQRKCGVAAAVVAVLLSACGGGGGGAGGTQAGSPPVTVPTAQAPSITSQPAAQSVSAGASATFTVAASGTDLAYQWQRDGKDITGATSASYTLDHVQSADTGAKFTVVVKNAGGSVTSGAAVLTVLPAAARGLAYVAGTLGGPGNLDGVGGRLASPVRVAMSPAGVLYVADDMSALAWDGLHPQGDTVLRIVNVATGDIETIDANPLRTVGMAFDAAGNLYEATATAVYRTAPNGKRALFAGPFNAVMALAADPQGNLYVGESGTLRRISPAGSITTVATGFTAITALAIDAGGTIQVIDNTSLRTVTSAGVVSTRALKDGDGSASIVAGSNGLAADKAGNMYVTNTYSGCRIRKIAPDGTMTDLAGQQSGRGGSDGKGAAAAFCKNIPAFYIPWQTGGTDLGNLAVDAAGNLVVADTTNQTIRRVTLDGVVSTVAGRAPSSLTNVDGAGAGAQFVLNTIDYREASPAFAVRSNYALAADAAGNVYVGENDRIRKITPDGNVGTLPLQAAGVKAAVLYLGGLAFGGNAYLADTTKPISRVNADGSLMALAGVDGGPGARTETDLAVDAPGNLYWLDYSNIGVPAPVTFPVRKMTPGGTVTTLPDTANSLGTPDADGNLWSVKPDGTVTRLGTDGKLTVVRTVSATAGAVPLAIARDRAGNLYVAWHEKPNWYSVHKITPAGVDSVVAGTPGAYGVRLGASSSLGAIGALTVGMDDNIYVISESSVLRIVP
jgi:sugar lactone lactonase YvrE